MPISTQEILEMLTEGPYVPALSSLQVSRAAVNYYAITSSGAKGRFSRTIAMSSLNQAQSETAVLFYLRGVHPKCDIIIQRLEFK